MRVDHFADEALRCPASNESTQAARRRHRVPGAEFSMGGVVLPVLRDRENTAVEVPIIPALPLVRSHRRAFVYHPHRAGEVLGDEVCLIVEYQRGDDHDGPVVPLISRTRSNSAVSNEFTIARKKFGIEMLDVAAPITGIIFIRVLVKPGGPSNQFSQRPLWPAPRTGPTPHNRRALPGRAVILSSASPSLRPSQRAKLDTKIIIGGPTPPRRRNSSMFVGYYFFLHPLNILFPIPPQVFSDVVLIAVVGTVIHTICGNMIEPALFGSSFDLHPIIVLFCLVVWSVLWGVTGAILSVPLTSCIKLGVQPFRRENVYAMIAFYALEFSLPSDKAWGDLERRRAEKRAEKWEAEMRRGRGFPRAGGGGGGGERGGGRGGGRVEVTAAALAEQARRCWEPKMGVISGEHKLRKNSANLATKDDTGFNGGDWMPEQIKKSAGLKGGPGGDSPPGRIAKNSINATPPDSTIPADSSARRAEDTSVADSTAKETAPTTQQHERRESIVPPLPEKAPSKTNSRRLRGLSDGDVIGMLGRGKGSGAGTSTPLSGGGASFSGRTVIPRPLFPPGGNSGRGMTGGNWNTSTSEDHTTTQGRRTGSETFSEGGEGGGGGLRKSLSSSTSVGELQPASSWRRREVVRGVVSSEEPRPTDSRRGGQSSSSRVSRAGSPSFGRASGRVSREAGRKSEDSTTSNRPSWQN